MADVEVNGVGVDEEQPQEAPVSAAAATVDDEDEAKKFRPADIDADVREMERRRRVDTIIHSRTFREDLERIVDQQMSGPAGLFAIQQHISDITGIGISIFSPALSILCPRLCPSSRSQSQTRENKRTQTTKGVSIEFHAFVKDFPASDLVAGRKRNKHDDDPALMFSSA